MSLLGSVHLIRRYPFKGMRGEDLARVFVRTSGLTGDRVYALTDAGSTSNFPWITSRLVPEMVLFEPKLLDPPPPEVKYPAESNYRVEITFPDGTVQAAESPAFVPALEARWGRKLKLRFSEGGMHDARPVSILGLSSLEQLEREVQMPLDHTRFRANFYVKWREPGPFFEETLLGRTIQIGDKVRVHVSKRNKRCVVITLDPRTAQSSPQILKHVGQKYGGNAGVYASVIDDGVVNVGDPISLV
ncbi:MAG TPA: MOSC domain-containing protein [Bdellovibrionales bacterium]|nr:MOSC domain-containing protein [Bdellovibrionales bacterium]